MTLRNPLNGKAALKFRVWFTTSGSSPDVPYFERKRMEERYVAVPGHLLEDDMSMSVSTEAGETFEP